MGRRRRIRRWLLVGILGMVMFALGMLQLRLSPLLRELATARVENRASYIINEAIEEQLENGDIDYDNIVFLEKDAHGGITALKTNMAEINRLKTQVLSIVDTMLLDLDVNEIGLPLGNLIVPELFSGMGPKLPVKVLSISNSDAEFRNVFSGAGINQTAHQIMMDVCIAMTVLTPAGTKSVEVVSSVLVAQTIIVGQVPGSYMNVE